jgi:hypothetical protein
MKLFLQITLCCLLAGTGMAQRGGGGGGGAHGGGMGGGGFRGGMSGGASRGGSFGGSGFRGGFGGFNGGFNRGGFVSGFGRGFGGFRGFRGGFIGSGFYSPFFYGGLYGGLGYGYGYGPGYYDYADPYAYGYGGGYPASSVYSGYNSSPNVMVVYPPQGQSAPTYVERASPVTHEYDQYGQEIRRPDDSQEGRRSGETSAPPIYLLAFKDHMIRAAAAYWVDGSTLHYVTMQHEEKQAPIDSVDRDFSMRLNHERRVQFQLPQ